MYTKHFSVISSDDDSGFNDGSSLAFSETPSEFTEQFSHKGRAWNCFSKSSKRRTKNKDYPENTPFSEPPPRREKFLQRVTRKIFGKTKKFRMKKDGKDGLRDEGIRVDGIERQNDSFIPGGPLKTYTSTQETTLLVDNIELFREDQLRCSIRRDPYYNGQQFRAEDRQTMLRVLFDFQASEENDVSVSRGELVRVLNRDDEDWWWVENAQRMRGFVPKSFLWPCGCYVCQKFILDRVNSVHTDSCGCQQGSGIREQATGMSRGRCVSCSDRKRVVATRKLTSTWC